MEKITLKDLKLFDKCISCAIELSEQYNKTYIQVLKIVREYIPLIDKYLNLDNYQFKKQLDAEYIKDKIRSIQHKYNLSDEQLYILKDYISHIHEESKYPFLIKLQLRDKLYIDEFLNASLEEFGESIFEQAEEDEKKTHPDLYNLVEENNVQKYLLVYNALLKRLRDMDRNNRDAIMAGPFKFKNIQGEDVSKRRTRFYQNFKKYFKLLSKNQRRIFIDNVFDRSQQFILILK